MISSRDSADSWTPSASSPLLGGELRREQQRVHAQHAVHGRPDLVAHRRQEALLAALACSAISASSCARSSARASSSLESAERIGGGDPADRGELEVGPDLLAERLQGQLRSRPLPRGTARGRTVPRCPSRAPVPRTGTSTTCPGGPVAAAWPGRRRPSAAAPGTRPRRSGPSRDASRRSRPRRRGSRDATRRTAWPCRGVGPRRQELRAAPSPGRTPTRTRDRAGDVAPIRSRLAAGRPGRCAGQQSPDLDERSRRASRSVDRPARLRSRAARPAARLRGRGGRGAVSDGRGICWWDRGVTRGSSGDRAPDSRCRWQCQWGVEGTSGCASRHSWVGCRERARSTGPVTDGPGQPTPPGVSSGGGRMASVRGGPGGRAQWCQTGESDRSAARRAPQPARPVAGHAGARPTGPAAAVRVRQPRRARGDHGVPRGGVQAGSGPLPPAGSTRTRMAPMRWAPSRPSIRIDFPAVSAAHPARGREPGLGRGPPGPGTGLVGRGHGHRCRGPGRHRPGRRGAPDRVRGHHPGRDRDAVVTSDAQGRVTFWNAGAERILGRSAADALGRAMGDCSPAGSSGAATS